jgi:hypothetical protein
MMMRPAEWVHLVNEEPDKVPHVVIVGGSGTGKTTLATGLLQTRPGRIIIITPKTDDTWGGLPFVTIDDDGSFTTAAAAFKDLLTEVKTRLVASKHGTNRAEWLNVVLDDYPALRSVCSEAQEALLLIARLGRSLRVRLLMLSYSGQVKELGLEGLGETRNHFVWIRLDRQRRARLEWDEQVYQLDTAAVIEHAARPLPAHRWWGPVPTAAALPARVRSSLSSFSGDDLDVPVRGNGGNFAGEIERTGTGGTDGTPHQEAVPGEFEMEERTEGIPAKLTPEAIRTLYSVWRSKNRIAAMLTGTKAKRMAIIDAALAEKEEVIDI